VGGSAGARGCGGKGVPASGAAAAGGAASGDGVGVVGDGAVHAVRGEADAGACALEVAQAEGRTGMTARVLPFQARSHADDDAAVVEHDRAAQWERLERLIDRALDGEREAWVEAWVESDRCWREDSDEPA
jgi:hypothetical protein